ncbi:MAG TPA: hypothetical protein VJ957_10660 [Longimicrobiales bacterium]|nr:hypothetical protein [Longimicrobiales bacterium]
MKRKRTVIRGLAWSLAATLPLVACNRGPSEEVQQELTTLRTQRDSLIREEAAKTQTMQRLSHAMEAIQGTSGESGALPPESLRDRITSMATNLNQAQSELASSRRRIRALSRRSASLSDSLQGVRALSDSLLAMQRDSISVLHRAMTNAVDSLGGRVSALSDTLQTLQKEHFTVYYAVGTEKELLDKGIITKVGGARFLGFLWKRGSALVPARSVQPDQFKAIDLRDSTRIALPAQGTYRVVSRQDGQYLAPTPDADGQFTGDHLAISDPDAFWQYSRFLIVVREQ